MIGTMASGAADGHDWLRTISKFRYRQPLTIASNYLVNTLYSYKGYGLSIGSMTCGFDHAGPHIFYVDNDGTRLPGRRFAIRSGPIHALGIPDTCCSNGLTKDETCDLGRKAIYLTTYRDSRSGGRVAVVQITDAGVEWVSQTDVLDLHNFDSEIRITQIAISGPSILQ
jgi:20S proteasome subunit beta 5